MIDWLADELEKMGKCCEIRRLGYLRMARKTKSAKTKAEQLARRRELALWLSWIERLQTKLDMERGARR